MALRRLTPVGVTVPAQGCRLGAQGSCSQPGTHPGPPVPIAGAGNPEPTLTFILSLSIMLLVFGAEQVRASEKDPSVGHGFGKVIGGLLFELPRTVIDATLTSPPVVGTMIGLLAGTARALQTTAAGVVEMAAGFDPWGAKKRQR